MPTLVITNNTASPSALSEPDTLFSEDVPANATSTFTDLSQETIDKLKPQLDDLASRVDANGAKEFVVDVQADVEDAGSEYAGVQDLIRWTGNHVQVDTTVAAPGTPSTVSARRVNIGAGSAVVDAEIFDSYLAAVDFTGDAEIDKDGADVSAVDLVAGQDTWMHVIMVNNASTREVIFVRGDNVPTGTGAVKLSEFQLATAVGVHLGKPGPYVNFVRLADVEFVNGVTAQNVTSLPPVPASYF